MSAASRAEHSRLKWHDSVVLDTAMDMVNWLSAGQSHPVRRGNHINKSATGPAGPTVLDQSEHPKGCSQQSLNKVKDY
jgi:hypothetical protein